MLKRTLATLAALSLLSLAACGDDTGDDDASGSNGGGSGDGGDVTCTYEADGSEPATKVELPPSEPAVSGKVNITLKTSVGDVKATLDADDAPCTVNSFVSLAEQDFFDGTQCHRMGAMPGFGFLQCGDPTATGTGGPGYSFADELSGDEEYTAATLAMANSGPDTNGSQFFMVFDDSQFDGPNYTTFGELDEASMKLLAGVGAKGTDDPSGVGMPKQKVEFTDIVVE